MAVNARTQMMVLAVSWGGQKMELLVQGKRELLVQGKRNCCDNNNPACAACMGKGKEVEGAWLYKLVPRWS